MLLPLLVSLMRSFGAMAAASDYWFEEAEYYFVMNAVDLLADGWLLPLLPLPAAAC